MEIGYVFTHDAYLQWVLYEGDTHNGLC
jgi:hypothetical protein